MTRVQVDSVLPYKKCYMKLHDEEYTMFYMFQNMTYMK